MSSREWCPGCDSETSTLKSAWDSGDECPVCGLSHKAWAEVRQIRLARDDDELALKYSQLRIAYDTLEKQHARIALQLKTIRQSLGMT